MPVGRVLAGCCGKPTVKMYTRKHSASPGLTSSILTRLSSGPHFVLEPCPILEIENSLQVPRTTNY
jgi:hypothetical protein